MRFVFVLLAFCASLTGHAAPPRLAYFGTLQGEITVPTLPALKWQLAATQPANARQSATFTLTGNGLTLRAVVDADETTGVVSWHIAEGNLELGTWLSAAVARYAPSLGTMSATGHLTLTGSGTLDGLKPSGRITLTCTDATVHNETGGWKLEGIQLAGDYALTPDGALESAHPFELRVQTITTSRLGARAFLMRGRLTEKTKIAVETAEVEIAGGKIDAAAPFTASLTPFEIFARVRVARIGLQDFAQLIPSGLADARGRLDGELRVGWKESTGLQLGIGHLSLDEMEPTILRLAPSPGLLTSSIPARFTFLPGKLGEWLSLRNDGYYDLREIELGNTQLRVDTLRMSITPDGDGQGRSAHVEIEATPLPPDGAVPKVNFTVNVAGPLAALLQLGMTQEFSTELH